MFNINKNYFYNNYLTAKTIIYNKNVFIKYFTV